MIALSFVLVSSALTAHMFFRLPTAFFTSAKGAEKSVISAYYTELSSALSLGSGLLFSATLIAAFGPGYFRLMSERHKDANPSSPVSTAETFFESIKIATEGITKIWKFVAAVVAPVLASPIFDLLNGIVAG